MVKKFKIFDSDSLKNIHKRVFFSITIFFVFYFIIFFRITDLMLINDSPNVNAHFQNNEEKERGKTKTKRESKVEITRESK